MPDTKGYLYEERPLIEHLQGMGWQYLPGDVQVPYLAERESFRQVLLTERLRQACGAPLRRRRRRGGRPCPSRVPAGTTNRRPYSEAPRCLVPGWA